MKSMAQIVLVFALLCGSAALAQTPRDEFNQALAQAQTNPNDQPARERVIKAALGLKPPPTIPEDARRHFVKATAFQKGAKSVSDYGTAIDEYRQALVIAPWWGDAYYNMGVALDSAGQFDEAGTAFKTYLLTNPPEKDARDAQDRIYVLEAKREKATKDKTADDAKKAAEDSKYGWLLGIWNEYFRITGTQLEYYGRIKATRNGNQVDFTPIDSRSGLFPGQREYTTQQIGADEKPLFRANVDEAGNILWQYYWGPGFPGQCPSQIGWQNYPVSISSDRSKITLSISPILSVQICVPSRSGNAYEFTLSRPPT